MTIPSEHMYVLGHATNELQRLALQGQYWGEATLELLQRAGVASGMRVLDVGCGAGDVSLLAAALVGDSGSILGVDRSPDAVAAAMARASAVDATRLQFRVAELDALESDAPFDAVVGRFVLLYLPDPAATLRRLAGMLRPGGIVAFLELDLTTARSVPPVPLAEAATEWVRETFRRAQVPIDLGPRVWRVFRAAGLPDPSLIVRSKAEPAPADAGVRYLAETVRSLLPMMERFQVTRSSDVDIESLADRLREALLAHEATFLPPSVVGAWTRKPA